MSDRHLVSRFVRTWTASLGPSSVLSVANRVQLNVWMIEVNTPSQRIRDGFPREWQSRLRNFPASIATTKEHRSIALAKINQGKLT